MEYNQPAKEDPPVPCVADAVEGEEDAGLYQAEGDAPQKIADKDELEEAVPCDRRDNGGTKVDILGYCADFK